MRPVASALPRPRVDVHTAVGIELDGDTATYAVAHQGRLRDTGTVSAGSPGEAITRALHRAKGSGPVVVAWAAKAGVIRQLPFPIVPPDARRSVLDALADKAAMGGLACARLGGPIPDGKEVISVIGAAPRIDVDRTFRDARDAPIHLLLAPMVISTDGVWLGIRWTGAELTVVDAHLPRLSRNLSCGGLDTVSGRLSAYGGDGSARLAAVLAGHGQGDIEALTIVDAYVTELCTQVHESLSFWRRSERIDGSTVFVHGRGADLPTIEARLEALGVNGFAPPETPGLGPVPSAVFCAAEAAQAAMADPSCFVGLPDLAAASRRAAMRRAATSGRRAVTAAAVTGVAGLALAIPVGVGRIAKHQADAHLATATHTITRLAAEETTYVYVNAGTRSWNSLAGGEPDWSAAVTSILASAPPTTRVETVTVEDTTRPGFVAVVIQAAAADPNLRDLQTWTATLQANSLVSDVFSTSAASRPDQTGGSSFEVQFEIATKGLLSPRPFPSDPHP